MNDTDANDKKVSTDEAIKVIQQEQLENRKQCGKKIAAILDEHGLTMDVQHTVVFLPKRK